MILVDTSAWVEFLRATGSSADAALERLAGSNRIATTDAVVAELMSGARSETELSAVRRMLSGPRFYPIRPLFDYESAADIHRRCRAAGSSPGMVECLIAAVAINNDLELLHRDADFEDIAEVTTLRLTS